MAAHQRIQSLPTTPKLSSTTFTGTANKNPQKNRVRFTPQCCSSTSQDAKLGAELRKMAMKHKLTGLKRTEAMKKSKEFLFESLSQHLGLKADEVKKKWVGLKELEKSEFLQGFVSDWGFEFHPLSIKSVKLLIEEYVAEEMPPPLQESSPLSISAFDRFKDFLGGGRQ